jgi:hypothetical protein
VGRGAEIIPAVLLDVDDDTAIRIMAGDNEIARKARRNNTALLALLDRLKPEIGLLGTGLTPRDVEVMTQLEKIPLDYDEYGTWPTLTIRVPPHVKTAFFDMTEGAEGERERFEVLLRMAGWEG